MRPVGAPHGVALRHFLRSKGLAAGLVPMMADCGDERTFRGPLIFVRSTAESGHTKAQCPLLGLSRTICSRVIDVRL